MESSWHYAGSGTKPLNKKRNIKTKWLRLRRALQIAEEKASKGERERYQLNAISGNSKKDKKAFEMSNAKKKERNIRMGRRLKISEEFGDMREHFIKDGHDKGRKAEGPSKGNRELTEVTKNTGKTMQNGLVFELYDGVVTITLGHPPDNR